MRCVVKKKNVFFCGRLLTCCGASASSVFVAFQNGKISQQELAQILRTANAEEVKANIREFDIDGDGQIDFGVFGVCGKCVRVVHGH